MYIEEKVDALCTSPTGCAFLMVVEENEVPVGSAADPSVAVHVAAVAVNAIDQWKSHHEHIVAMALAQGPRLRNLARAILARPETAWWFAPIDLEAQWRILRPDSNVGPEGLVAPASPPTNWELYAQKPATTSYSSTVVGDTCSILAAMEHLAGDFRPVPPIGRLRLRASSQARVFEVDGPQAWRQLATRYPSHNEQGLIVPDWGLFAEEWDAVHLTLGGLLTAEQVRIGIAERTELQGWAAEQTAWVRWCFEEVDRLPDLANPPPSPVPLDPPIGLQIPDPSSPGAWFLALNP